MDEVAASEDSADRLSMRTRAKEAHQREAKRRFNERGTTATVVTKGIAGKDCSTASACNCDDGSNESRDEAQSSGGEPCASIEEGEQGPKAGRE